MAFQSPKEALDKISSAVGLDLDSHEFANYMDSVDPLKDFRKRFAYPKRGNLPIDVRLSGDEANEECVYLCGNSLGLMPYAAKHYQDEQMMKWANLGVFTHFHGALPAATCDQPGKAYTAELVGAEEDEVVIMNGLSVNLHLFLNAFYKPDKSSRYKIMYESHAFPSDRYAFRSAVEMAGLSPDAAIVELKPRQGEQTLRTEDILEAIEREGDKLALVLFSGVHYYTGQKFDIPAITKAAQAKGAFAGWDLAHAIGNIKLELHDWNVDFAVWCTYKYLNSGAGGIAGGFLHSRYKNNPPTHYHGWFSNSQSTRFEMREKVDLAPGADSFRLCNPPPFLACLNYASLEIFHDAGMDRILQKQFLITGWLEFLLRKHFSGTGETSTKLEIITPADYRQRGCQLSLVFNMDLEKVHKQLEANGVVCDVRRPSGMRIAPAPLYNSYNDVWRFIRILKMVTASQIEQ